MHPVVILEIVRNTIVEVDVALLDIFQVAHHEGLSQTFIEREIIVFELWHSVMPLLIFLVLRKRKRGIFLIDLHHLSLLLELGHLARRQLARLEQIRRLLLGWLGIVCEDRRCSQFLPRPLRVDRWVQTPLRLANILIIH